MSEERPLTEEQLKVLLDRYYQFKPLDEWPRELEALVRSIRPSTWTPGSLPPWTRRHCGSVR